MRPSIFHGAVMILILTVVLPVLPLRAAESASDLLWQEASQLQQAEQFTQAADRYRTILRQETRWKKRAKAALLAANCLDRVGRSNESIPLLDAAIAEADNLLAQDKPGVDESWTLPALYSKAVACEKIGDRTGALKAIERIRAQFFKSDEARQAVQIQARLENWSPQKLTQTLAREQEAMQLAEQAAEASKQKRHKEALESCDRILQQYADTAAAFPAMRTKALTLWNMGGYREARAVYQKILDRVKPIAPNSRLVRTAEYRVAWLDAGSLLKDLAGRRRRGSVIPAEQWQRLEMLCNEVVAKDPDPAERAMAQIMVIEGLNWQGRSEEVLARATQFLDKHAGAKGLIKFKEQIGAAHIFAGIALRKLGRYEEALTHFRWVTNSLDAVPESRLSTHAVEAARLHEWLTLRASGAEGTVIQAILRLRAGHSDTGETASSIQRMVPENEDNAGR